MSDKPEGPGWWIATDGKWYPPELHPTFNDDVREEPTTPRTVPHQVPVQQTPVQGTVQTPPGPAAGEPRPLRRQGQAQKAATAGRQFPDLFQKALQGSHLADNIRVTYDGDDERNEPRPADAAPSGSMRKMTPGGGTPVAADTAGVTFGAPAKRKWRKGR